MVTNHSWVFSCKFLLLVGIADRKTLLLLSKMQNPSRTLTFCWPFDTIQWWDKMRWKLPGCNSNSTSCHAMLLIWRSHPDRSQLCFWHLNYSAQWRLYLNLKVLSLSCLIKSTSVWFKRKVRCYFWSVLECCKLNIGPLILAYDITDSTFTTRSEIQTL